MKKIIILGKQLTIQNTLFTELTNFFGLSKAKSSIICSKRHLSIKTTLKDLSTSKIAKITRILQNITLEAELHKNNFESLNHLIIVKNYRSYRHKVGLPVRGQNTKNNSKTQKKIAIKRLKLNK